MPDTTRPYSDLQLASRAGWAVSALLLAGFLSGCSSPLAIQSERDLRRSVIDSIRREVSQAQDVPAIRSTTREGGLDRLKLKPDLMPVYEQMAGPASYDKNNFTLDEDLLGQPQARAPLTLERAIRSAIVNNLEAQFARLQPAIAEAQVVAAQAAFDTTLFNNFEWNNVDAPRAQFRQGFSTSGLSSDKRQAVTNATGLRRNLTTGGQIVFQQDANYTDVNTDGGTNVPNPTDELAWTLRFDQPLLRGFGSDVTLAQVRINRNGERDQICQLKARLLRVISDTERAYWQLVQAQRSLLILQRLYERGIKVRDQVIAREILDASPAQIGDARATVERRLQDIIRAQNAFRNASDALKTLINDPEFPIGSEVLLVPVDDALDAPIKFSLLDVMLTATRCRPEMQQAILSIDNTSIRQQVADNARLPKLDLRLQSKISAMEDKFSSAFDEATDRQFIDYLVGLQFEQPIGNRAAEAQYRQRRLERMQATIAYRNTVQQIILDTKRSLRSVVTGYRLIEQSRIARYAASENLRSLEVEKQVSRGFDVTSLDLEFRRQESLAQAEQDEISSLVDYNNALSQLYVSMGTALERNNIEFKVPDADDPLDKGGLDNPPDGKVLKKDAPTPSIAPVGPKTPYIFGGERRPR